MNAKMVVFLAELSSAFFSSLVAALHFSEGNYSTATCFSLVFVLSFFGAARDHVGRPVKVFLYFYFAVLPISLVAAFLPGILGLAGLLQSLALASWIVRDLAANSYYRQIDKAAKFDKVD
jgi:hypothetical protein